MELCLLKFALPVNLSLPNGKTFFFQEAGRLVAIETTTNRGTVIFNFERTYTDWTQPGSRVEARHDRSVGSEDSLFFTYKIDDPSLDFKGGTIDEISYTILTLYFENEGEDFLDKLDEHIVWAKPRVQRFVDNHRLATRRYWLGEAEPFASKVILAAKATGPYTFDDGKVEATIQTGKHHGTL